MKSLPGDEIRVRYYMVPLNIFGGKISVDFAKIAKYLSDHLDYDPGSKK